MKKNFVQNLREWMVELQIKARGIDNERILEAFLSISREEFVKKELKASAYDDIPLPIGYNQTISQPYVVALMTSLIEPELKDIVLEIGSGSGYQAAILSRLVKKVVSIEIIEELADFAKKNLKRIGIKNVKIIHSDGTELSNVNEQFDKIIVTAATGTIPKKWIELLKERGFLVIPQGDIYLQELVKFQKINGKLFEVERSIPVRFVPLKGKGGLI